MNAVTGYVYVITNRLNGKQYVGQTTQSIERRWRQHLKRREQGQPQCPALYAAIQEFGVDAFDVSLLVALPSGSTQNALDRAEQDAIARLNTLAPSGYNLTPGGFGQGPLHPQTKAKLRAINLGRKRSASEIEETAARLKGRKRPPEVIDKIRRANIGKKRTPEQIAAMSALRKGISPTPEVRAKLSAAFKGRIFTPEWCAKISAAKSGKPPRGCGWTHSEETKQKIRETNRATWAHKHGAVA